MSETGLCPRCNATSPKIGEWNCGSVGFGTDFYQTDKCRRVELQTQAYAAMVLVDEILGLKVTEGTGTCESTFLEDVKKARREVKKLQVMKARVVAVTEARDRLEERLGGFGL